MKTAHCAMTNEAEDSFNRLKYVDECKSVCKCMRNEFIKQTKTGYITRSYESHSLALTSTNKQHSNEVKISVFFAASPTANLHHCCSSLSRLLKVWKCLHPSTILFTHFTATRTPYTFENKNYVTSTNFAQHFWLLFGTPALAPTRWWCFSGWKERKSWKQSRAVKVPH